MINVKLQEQLLAANMKQWVIFVLYGVLQIRFKEKKAEKMGNGRNKNFLERNMVASKNMKRCSTSLKIKKTQMRINCGIQILSCHIVDYSNVNSKQPSDAENVQKSPFSHC